MRPSIRRTQHLDSRWLTLDNPRISRSRNRTMTLSRMAWVLLAPALLMAGTALAQLTVEPPGGGGGGLSISPPTSNLTPQTKPLTTETKPQTTAPATMQSAESILQQLLNNTTKPGTSPTTAGAGGAGGAGGAEALPTSMGPVPGPDGLLLEGQKIELRSGHLKREAGGMVFVFDEKESPAYPPMGVVPSRRLAAMEDAAGFPDNAAGSDMTFRIKAEVTQYRGKNYLYIQPLGIPLPPPAKPVAPAATVPVVTPIAPQTPVVAPLPQGNIITLRVGRLVRDAKSGTELIVFDADGKLLQDPPMGVIPCKLLEIVEDATDNGSKPLKFVISGEVTTYRGKNYLYLKVAKKVVDLNRGLGTGVNPG
jgi:hypothetical protein